MGNNFDSFATFRGLHDLKIQGCGEEGSIPDTAFSRWPHLESLQLGDSGFAEDLKLMQRGLRSLQTIDWEGHCSPALACSSLEHMWVCHMCLKHRHHMPNIEDGRNWEGETNARYGFWDDVDRSEEPFDFVHEGVEE